MTDRSTCIALAALVANLLVAACSGGPGSGKNDETDGPVADDDGGDGARGGRAGDDGPLVLDRIPDAPLTCDEPAALHVGQTPLVRLGAHEYANTLADLLAPLTLPRSPDVTALGTLRPGFAEDNAFSASNDLVDSQAEQADPLGPLVAENLGKMGIAGCPPKGEADEAQCLDAFVDGFVFRAFRRPVRDDERERLRGLFTKVRAANDFPDTLATVVQAVLQAPQFLYRLEQGVDGDGNARRLDGYEMASRLSYLLWSRMPDDELFAAARAGELDSVAGIAREVDRMLADERAHALVKDFATAWLQLDDRLPSAASAAKNTEVFPDYTPDVAADLLAGLDRFLVDGLLGAGGGIDRLLSEPRAFVNARTAFIYGVEADGDALVSTALDPQRRRGLLTQGAILSALASREKHAPVRRGMFVLERIMCQPPPAPPNGMVPPPPEPDLSQKRTTRQRLVEEHEAQGGGCKSCHQIIDGVGFAFEHYDAIGRWQDEEDGMPVDASASIANTYDLDGEYDGAIPLIETLARSEQVAQCFVESFYRYALARVLDEGDGCNIARLTARVLDDDDGFRSLLLGVAGTDSFRHRSAFLP